MEGINKRDMRLGERKLMGNGMYATITSYRNNVDMDIKFEDGSIRQGVTYQNFVNGKIASDTVRRKRGVERGHIAKMRTGEVAVMNNGLKAKIVKYEDAQDITVQFEDGSIKEHTTYHQFIYGGIASKNTTTILERNKKSRMGETRVMNNSLRARVKEYRNAGDIDIVFENGRIAQHVTYNNFKNGQVSDCGKKVV